MLNQQKCDVSSRRHQHNGDFRALMAECGINAVTLSKRIDVHPNTVSRWHNDQVDVPGAVLAYLRLYRDVKALL